MLEDHAGACRRLNLHGHFAGLPLLAVNRRAQRGIDPLRQRALAEGHRLRPRALCRQDECGAAADRLRLRRAVLRDNRQLDALQRRAQRVDHADEHLSAHRVVHDDLLAGHGNRLPVKGIARRRALLNQIELHIFGQREADRLLARAHDHRLARIERIRPANHLPASGKNVHAELAPREAGERPGPVAVLGERKPLHAQADAACQLLRVHRRDVDIIAQLFLLCPRLRGKQKQGRRHQRRTCSDNMLVHLISSAKQGNP